MNKLISIYSDGASRKNPGKSGIGFVIYCDKLLLFKKGFYIDIASNNQAEYLALIGSILCFKYHYFDIVKDCRIIIHCDSLLLVHQLQGNYKVRNKGIQILFEYLKELLKDITWEIVHVFREFNKEADSLANEGIDSEILLPDYLKVCSELLNNAILAGASIK